MPIIPRFSLSQNDEFVLIDIVVPYVRVSNMDFTIDENMFSFWCKPYLLKLTFPHPLIDDDRAKATYDPNKEHGTIMVKVPKLTRGLVFDDLDLITSLLQPKRARDDRKGASSSRAPTIELVSDENAQHNEGNDNEEDEELDESDGIPLWCKDIYENAISPSERPSATPPHAETTANLHKIFEQPSYGFDNAFTNFFKNLHEELFDIIELPEPDSTMPEERQRLRLAKEEQDFDGDRVVADTNHIGDDAIYEEATKFAPFWSEMYKQIQTQCQGDAVCRLRPSVLSASATHASTSSVVKKSAELMQLERSSASTSFKTPSSQLLIESLEEPKETVTPQAVQNDIPQTSRPLIQVISDDETVEAKSLSQKMEDLSVITDKPTAALQPSESPRVPSENAPTAESSKASSIKSEISLLVPKTVAVASKEDEDAWIKGAVQLFSGYSKEEQDVLARLPNKEYLIRRGSKEEERLLLGLVDILSAIAYDYRLTTGEGNVESGWTITALSPLLSWLEYPKNILHALKGVGRRALIYPYLRNWNLVLSVWNDVRQILASGKRAVVRALLYGFQWIEKHETRYLLNKLYLDDYAVWVQKLQDRTFLHLSQAVNAALNSLKDKDSLGWPLTKLLDEEDETTSEDESDSSSSDETSDSSSSSEEESSEEESEDEAHRSIPGETNTGGDTGTMANSLVLAAQTGTEPREHTSITQ